jgi:hypothetical protein
MTGMLLPSVPRPLDFPRDDGANVESGRLFEFFRRPDTSSGAAGISVVVVFLSSSSIA